MGRAITNHDPTSVKARERYQRNKTRYLARAKQYYADHREIYLANMKRGRDAVRNFRLADKRRAFYGERLAFLPAIGWTAVSAYVQAFKDGQPCLDCGHIYPYYVLEFDHVRGKKDRNVSDCSTVTQAKREIAKCDLVCANCHRERTFSRL